MKIHPRTLTITLFSLAVLGLGALAVGKSALGFIVSSQDDQQERVVQNQNVASELASDSFAQGTFSDPLITLVKPLAPLREDTPFAPTVLPTDPVLPAISSPLERGEMQEGGVEPVNIVLFCDHVVEVCRDAVKQISAYIRDDLRESASYLRPSAHLVWKDFPNPLDPASRPAALAARCAQNQGKFWEFIDKLTRDEVMNDDLRESASYLRASASKYGIIASELGLNLEEFNRCVETRATTDLVNQGMDEAQALDIDGIPALFINSYRLTGEITEKKIERLVELEF
ncbi:MAG: thioredoxin domain-containing protein [Patescibacteria group bacterium]